MPRTVISTIAVMALAVGGALSLTGCPKVLPTTTFIAIDTSTQHELKYARQFLDDFSLESQHSNWLVVDVHSGAEVTNKYSNPPSEKAVDELSRELTQVASEDRALLAALDHAQRYLKKLGNGEHLTVVILTEGTSNPQVIAAMKAFSNKFGPPERNTIIFAGLSAAHRLRLSQAFSAIENRVQFFGNGDSELDELLKLL